MITIDHDVSEILWLLRVVLMLLSFWLGWFIMEKIRSAK